MLLFFCIIYVQKEWQKSLIIAGHDVMFHGRKFHIDYTQTDSRTKKYWIHLEGYNGLLPPDSIQSCYRLSGSFS